MPSSESVLSGLTKLANDWQWLAIVFHVSFGALVVLSLPAFESGND